MTDAPDRRILHETDETSAQRNELLGFCDEVQHCYFASGLTDSHGDMDEDEVIEAVRMTVADVEIAIAGRTINDGKSVAIFCRARIAGII